MPYISIKAYPKDEEIKKEVVNRINDIFLELWGCSQDAISISIEEINPDIWEEEVVNAEIIPNKDKMMIFNGEKKY